MIKALFYFLIFPGFLFTAVVGLLASWIDRKVTAKVQWRKGPPWYQGFADFVKLLGKETTIPENAEKISFLLAPIFSLTALTLVSTLIWVAIIQPQTGFVGDLIVVFYLLAIPAISVIIGGAASGNPLASQGIRREINLLLAYELPFILVCLVPIIRSGSIKLGAILAYQASNGMLLSSWAGAIAFIVAIFCIQAKMTLVPFDMPEAETELMAGPYIEYSGPPLAIYKLARAMMLFVIPMFLVVLFWGGIDLASWQTICMSLLKYVAVLVIVVLIRNTNPRVRIDQAIRFFWGPMTVLAILSIILTFLGV